MLEKYDKENMFDSIWNFSDNLKEALDIGEKINIKNKYSKIHNVVIAGMGGSAIGGDIVSVLENVNIKIPYFVCRDYSIPAWVSSKSLVICSSYSGNTEETISAFYKAKDKGAYICGITTGGTLLHLLEENKRDIIKIPSGLQPRAAIAYSFIPIIKFLEKVGIIRTDLTTWIKKCIDSLEKNRLIYGKEGNENPIYELANQIYKKIPIIYSDTSTMRINAVRLKGQLNENGKMLAYCNEIPELNHNEIVGWQNNQDIFKNLCVLWLEDESDNIRTKIRKDITETILNEVNIDQYSIQINGDLFQERFLNMIHYGDWLSFWCAILHETDPSPVKKIDRLKNELGSKN
ncbi:MAG: bifunctional phosphoglucose/phosphomannose isomerase [Candidatus Marinimicrobia bacterium]|nr:bifunctional phosphoglucose/phosphomannose isomerase [Candidatus Neomarinimicrobiota bacterium]